MDNQCGASEGIISDRRRSGKRGAWTTGDHRRRPWRYPAEGSEIPLRQVRQPTHRPCDEGGLRSVGPLPEFGAPALQVIDHPQINALNLGNVFPATQRACADQRLGPLRAVYDTAE